jgi:hypothetical protein
VATGQELLWYGGGTLPGRQVLASFLGLRISQGRTSSTSQCAAWPMMMLAPQNDGSPLRNPESSPLESQCIARLGHT